jgi:hypothetical protein
MTPLEREVRARIYEMFVDGFHWVDASVLVSHIDLGENEIRIALEGLADEHRIALTPDGRVWMAHPFSGVPTSYLSVIGDRHWYANCAWDALAILALLGDGVVRGGEGFLWQVEDGLVSPNGYVHLVVPARSFWDDIGFT